MFSFFRKTRKDVPPSINNCTTDPKRAPYTPIHRQHDESLPPSEKPYKNNNFETGTRLVDDERISNDLGASAGGASTKMSNIPKKGGNVKPCGHGTTAIAPWVPNFAAKRENSSTPPSSPTTEAKKHFKAGDGDEMRNDGDNMMTKNLINQEAKFQSQLNDLSKQLSIRDAEATKLRFEMEELQRDVFAKTAGMDRLQAELNAAYKECDSIKQRIRNLEHEVDVGRQGNGDLKEALDEKEEIFANYQSETKAKILELENVIKELQGRIEELESQLASLAEEKNALQDRHTELTAECEEEKKKVEETMQNATEQKKEIERKWKEEFEKMRTINIVKEQQLLDDFEWKLREVHKNCKKRLEDKDEEIKGRLTEAYQLAEEKMKEANEMTSRVEDLESVEEEVAHLRGLTVNQEKAIKEMQEQQEQMKQAEEGLKVETKRLRTLIDMEKENLQHMQRLHHQEIVDKERNLKQTLNQKRLEIAMYWEERLMTECGRLKYEMELIHNEEKFGAMEAVRKEKEDEFQRQKREWENKMRECLKEITMLKKMMLEKEKYYHEEMVRMQTDTDREVMELRRLMDKIDMCHHEKYEKLVLEHEEELCRLSKDNESKMDELESLCQNQVVALRKTLEEVKEQMESESREKIEELIQQHRAELDAQWENLIDQKTDAISLVEEEYINKYKTLEEQFYTQQKSHTQREIELLKTIDSLKNELQSKESTIDDLQSNIDTLEGGIQVLNAEIAQQGAHLSKSQLDSDAKISNLEEMVSDLQEQQEKERETFRLKLMSVQKQNGDSIMHLQRKCQCLTKLFEEVRMRYERRDSRQEDLNIISDLRQVIAEQEKDLACINEEKRYFQMRLMSLEKQMETQIVSADEEDEYEDAEQIRSMNEPIIEEPDDHPQPNRSKNKQNPVYNPMLNNPVVSIPPTIPECDDDE